MQYHLITEDNQQEITCDKVIYQDTHTLFIEDGEAKLIIRNDQIVQLWSNKVPIKNSFEGPTSL